MKAKEIREMTPEELDRALLDSRKEIFNLRLQFQTGQLENSARIRALRKDVARLETEKSARRVKAEGKQPKQSRAVRLVAAAKLARAAENEARHQANLKKKAAEQAAK